jgi:hypothetical protein
MLRSRRGRSTWTHYGPRSQRSAPSTIFDVPRLSEFFGIIIAMYYHDHWPPHFHARYGEHEATVRIDTLAVLGGALPRRAYGLVLEWAAFHRRELAENWERAREGEPLSRIAPLD